MKGSSRENIHTKEQGCLERGYWGIFWWPFIFYIGNPTLKRTSETWECVFEGTKCNYLTIWKILCSSSIHQVKYLRPPSDNAIGKSYFRNNQSFRHVCGAQRTVAGAAPGRNHEFGQHWHMGCCCQTWNFTKLDSLRLHVRDIIIYKKLNLLCELPTGLVW